MSNKTNYFVLKGNIGFYQTREQALKNCNYEINDVVTLRKYDYRKQLVRELYKIATIRTDLDFLSYKPYIGDAASKIQNLNNSTYYTVAYYNRIISADGFKYGFILFNTGHRYEYVNPNIDTFRGSQADISALMKLKELERKYGFKGVIRTPAPIEHEVRKYLPHWEYEFCHPADYDMAMRSLCNVLNGKDKIIDTTSI